MTLLDGGTWAGRIYSGEWTPGSGGEYEAIEPATGAVLGSVGCQLRVDTMRRYAQTACRFRTYRRHRRAPIACYTRGR